MFQIVGSHSILCRKALIYQLITLNIKWLTSEMLPVDTLSQPVATATFFRHHKNVQCLPIGKIKSNVPTYLEVHQSWIGKHNDFQFLIRGAPNMKILEMKNQLCNNNIGMHNIIHKSKSKYIIHIPSPA